MQDLFVQEEEGAQRLILRLSAHSPADCEARETVRDLGLPHIEEMALVVVKDEAADPTDVRVFGPAALVPGPDRSTHAVEKPRLGRSPPWKFAHAKDSGTGIRKPGASVTSAGGSCRCRHVG